MINHVGLYDENLLPEAITPHPKYNLLTTQKMWDDWIRPASHPTSRRYSQGLILFRALMAAN